jgi:hypothetical protein
MKETSPGGPTRSRNNRSNKHRTTRSRKHTRRGEGDEKEEMNLPLAAAVGGGEGSVAGDQTRSRRRWRRGPWRREVGRETISSPPAGSAAVVPSVAASAVAGEERGEAV